MKKNIIMGMLCLFTSGIVNAQTTTKADSAAAVVVKETPVQKKWYDQLSIKGYFQIRYNRLLETNDSLRCEQCDKSWGVGGMFLRRARITLSGNVGERVFVSIQPDFASSTSNGLNFVQLRDAYADIYLDEEKQFRFRLGQSKVPFGFENLQSSQSRITLDRADALNSAYANERDLGVFFYWTPKKTKELFSSLVKDGLRGTGDYGMFGAGLFNGQAANKADVNKEPHLVARFSYPVAIKNQVIEAGVQAIKGNYSIESKSSKTKIQKSGWFEDDRVAASLILYPKPFGIQAEYNVGKGPEFNKMTDSIEAQSLKGGYIMACYMLKLDKHVFVPFARLQYYDGGKKYELDARSYNVKEYEFGVEWQANKNIEFTACYTISERRFEDYALRYNDQKGSLLRLQAQVNF